MLQDFLSIFTSLNLYVTICMFGFALFAFLYLFLPKFKFGGILASLLLLAGVIFHIFLVKKPFQLFCVIILFALPVLIIFLIKKAALKAKWYKKNPSIKKETMNPLNYERAQKNEDLSYLLHLKGVAKTELRPSGLMQIREETFEVVTMGEYIDEGSEIEVIKIEGSRIFVKPVKGGK